MSLMSRCSNAASGRRRADAVLAAVGYRCTCRRADAAVGRRQADVEQMQLRVVGKQMLCMQL